MKLYRVPLTVQSMAWKKPFIDSQMLGPVSNSSYFNRKCSVIPLKKTSNWSMPEQDLNVRLLLVSE